MTAHHVEHDVDLRCGHVLDELAAMPDESVQCVVTSPPYYGLRDYGTEPVEWPAVTFAPLVGLAAITAPESRSSLGLEPDLWSYVAHIVAVFREVRRVLRSDGVLWLNLGDSYAAKARGSDVGWGKSRLTNPGTQQKAQAASLRSTGERHRGKSAGISEKNLLGVPWRIAFALQADGWTVRNDGIWHKPNAMPESVPDRLSNRYEHLFLFSKHARYRFDLDAIKVRTTGKMPGNSPADRTAYGEASGVGRDRRFGGNPHSTLLDRHETRNPGDVWSITTKPFPGAHFAVMPHDLAKLCVLAGSVEGDTVLDPFAGAGTVLLAARQLGRLSTGIEIRTDYCDLIVDRLGDPTLDFIEAI